jgi:hypothetical protein
MRLIEYSVRRWGIFKRVLLAYAGGVAVLALWATSVRLSARAFPEASRPGQVLQTRAENGGTGILVGQVICDDSGKPARLALVVIAPVNPPASQASRGGQRVSYGPSTHEGKKLYSVMVDPGEETDLNGQFMRTGMAPGSYRVSALFPGYVSNTFEYSRAMERGDAATAEATDKNTTHVTIGDGTSTVAIRLKRGATLSGHVKFADGTPVAGVGVDLLRREEGRRPFQFGLLGNAYSGSPTGVTDSEGSFRFAGIPSGSYVIRAQPTNWYFGPNSFLTRAMGFGSGVNGTTENYYSGGSSSSGDATIFQLRAGDSKVANITIDPALLHAVSGHMVSAEDGHAPNGDVVILTRGNDIGDSQMTNIQSNGSFRFDHVPDGTYELDARAQDWTWDWPQGGPPKFTMKNSRCNYADVKVNVEMRSRDIDLGLLSAQKGWQAKDVTSCADVAKSEAIPHAASVTVRVEFGDPARPARFAHVALLPVTSSSAEQASMPGLQRLTGLDGAAEFAAIRPGEYYVIAELAGYLSSASGFSAEEMQRPTTETYAKATQTLQKIALGEDRNENVVVLLRRGAAIEGDVIYDDGSPAVQIPVDAILASRNSDSPTAISFDLPSPTYFHDADAYTDDRGHYKMSGLPAGAYLIRLTIPVGASEGKQAVGLGAYMPGGFGHQSIYEYSPNADTRDAAIRVLAIDGETKQVNLVVRQSSLHAVSGRAIAPRVRGDVAFLYATLRRDGQDESQQRIARISPDGSFRFAFVPPGSYTLRTEVRIDNLPYLPNSELFRAEQKVVVLDKDLTGIDLQLAATSAKNE